jgi:branched-subunit amino acid aminotransferase/4-amino-4-deoxychorismate lyase
VHVFLDGEFLPIERAVIPVDDRGFLYGDALFETMPFYGGVPFRWGAHLARLEQGLKLLRIALPYPAAKLEGFASELVKLDNMRDCVLRLTVSRGSAPRGYSIKLAQKPRVLMTLHPLPKKSVAGWRLITSSFRVLADDPLNQLKTGSRVRSVLARAEAEEQGAEEALLLNERGEITEGAATNVFCVQRGVVCTPPLAAGILPGITRAVVFEICRHLGVAISEKPMTPSGLFGADGVFLTVSTAGIVEATSLDARPLAQSPLIAQLQAAYQDVVRAETSRSR